LHRSNLSHISSWRRNAQGKSVAEGINESNSPAPDEMETAMKFEFIRRYFRERRAYWNVIRELSTYSDRELHDLGIDRADIEQIAREAARA
jgi:uncharacterized protein YjiS (DUF1127 family)